jgi:hypothetical protein
MISIPMNFAFWIMKIITKENRIRTKLGMRERQLHILDTELIKLLALDNYALGRTCMEFLDGMEQSE